MPQLPLIAIAGKIYRHCEESEGRRGNPPPKLSSKTIVIANKKFRLYEQNLSSLREQRSNPLPQQSIHQ